MDAAALIQAAWVPDSDEGSLTLIIAKRRNNAQSIEEIVGEDNWYPSRFIKYFSAEHRVA